MGATLGWAVVALHALVAVGLLASVRWWTSTERAVPAATPPATPAAPAAHAAPAAPAPRSTRAPGRRGGGPAPRRRAPRDDQYDDYYDRGLVYEVLQDYEQAIEDYSRAAELVAHPLITYSLARVYTLQNQPEESCAWLEKAIELDSQYRDQARTDPDFDLIRNHPCFQALMNDE